MEKERRKGACIPPLGSKGPKALLLSSPTLPRGRTACLLLEEVMGRKEELWRGGPAPEVVTADKRRQDDLLPLSLPLEGLEEPLPLAWFVPGDLLGVWR